MHDDSGFVEGRLRRTLRQVIAPAVDRWSTPLTLSAWQVADPVPFAEAAAAGGYEPAVVGMEWGPPWATTWFRAEGVIPYEWAGQRVEAVIDLFDPVPQAGFQAEALVYDSGGVPLKGLHPRNHHVAVSRSAAGGESVLLHVEAASNPVVLDVSFAPSPLGDRATAGDAPLYRIRRADLVVRDETVWHLRLDAEVLSELLATLPATDPRRFDVARALDRMLDVLDPADVAGTAAAARAELAPALAAPANASALTMSAVANAHIDSAWLWPIRETIRKCVRTYANVAALADDYPELIFAASQAQHLAWLAEAAPDVHQRVVAAVKAGNVVPVGAMWVEPDGNVPGGEAMARQLVHGKRYFIDELGVDGREAWMPDSFGYSAALPQLARLAGIEWFLTQKLSWNDTNRFPHHSFWWEGIDGSRVFTHFPPVDTYTAELTGAELARAVTGFADKGRSRRALLPFGHGDGGGGPTREMLERARRWRNLEGAPRVELTTPAEFFAAAQAEYPDAAVWSGELYLELHRATFTNQAALKRGNRRCEHLLREAELWCATAAVAGDHPYPHDDLHRLWKTVLLHQFHDILPGTSIAWVNREAVATYAETVAELEALIAVALSALVGDGEVEWAANGAPRPVDAPVSGSSRWPTVPALGLSRLDAEAPFHTGSPGGTDATGAAAGDPVPVTVGDRALGPGRVLDNGLVRVEVDERGLVVSLIDLLAGRELIAPGEAGGLLQLHRDQPTRWDAWDLDRSYLRLGVDVDDITGLTIDEHGPAVGAITVERQVGASTIRQTVSIRAGSADVRFDTDVDWHERERILKLAFPLDIHGDQVAAEIQFGHVRRPTHTNTSWDAARFEHCCHRWVHVAEPGYGVALVNDATYGYDVARTVGPSGTVTTIRPSLVRGARHPDPGADAGRHRFSHVVVPGASVGDAVGAGYAVNLPVRRIFGADGPATAPLVGVDNEAVVVEAVKLADDQSGDVVVRIYESLGGRALTHLTTAFPLAGAVVVDLLERPDVGHLVQPGLAVDEAAGSVSLSLRPFQIVTLRLTPAHPPRG